MNDAELTTGTDEDPRRRALGHFKPRPPEPSASPAGLRSMTGPPPAKPPAVDLAEPTHARQQRRPRSVGDAPASVTRRTPRREVDSTGYSPFGSARGNLREIQFLVSPQLSGALSDRAEHEDVVLGEIVMAAVRRVPREDNPAPRLRQRRRGNSVRRTAVVPPHEAEEVRDLATALGTTPSALIRSALEHYLAN